MSSRLLSTLDAPTTPDEVAGFLPKLRAALDGSGPALMLVPPEHGSPRRRLLQAVPPDRRVPDDEVALVVPTSGTTGSPRLVMLGPQALRAAVGASSELLGGTATYLLTLPTQYVAGLMVLVRSVLTGNPPVLMDLGHGFTPAAFVAGAHALTTRTTPGRTATALVPTQLARLLDSGAEATRAMTALDAVLIGGAACPPALLDRARAAGVRVVTTYGMTETCGGCVYDGRLMRGVSAALEPDGRIRLKGPVLFDGYLGEPDLTRQVLDGGWFLTSDLGRWRDDGRLEVLGRLDDVVVSGGVNVSLAAVEAELAAVPGVVGAVVVPVDDELWGVRLVAVVAQQGAERPVTLSQLRGHVRERLGPAAAPADLLLVPRLPSLTSGKPDRRAVRNLVQREVSP
jgi:O-succinylbenzoic acid--CoA ligase